MKQTILITAIIVLLSISCVSAATVSHTASQILPGIFQAGTWLVEYDNNTKVLTVTVVLDHIDMDKGDQKIKGNQIFFLI